MVLRIESQRRGEEGRGGGPDVLSARYLGRRGGPGADAGSFSTLGPTRRWWAWRSMACRTAAGFWVLEEPWIDDEMMWILGAACNTYADGPRKRRLRRAGERGAESVRGSE